MDWSFANYRSDFPLIFLESPAENCVKSVQIRSFLWSLLSCIQSEYRKIWTRKNSVYGHFSHSGVLSTNSCKSESSTPALLLSAVTMWQVGNVLETSQFCQLINQKCRNSIFKNTRSRRTTSKIVCCTWLLNKAFLKNAN